MTEDPPSCHHVRLWFVLGRGSLMLTRIEWRDGEELVREYGVRQRNEVPWVCYTPHDKAQYFANMLAMMADLEERHPRRSEWKARKLAKKKAKERFDAGRIGPGPRLPTKRPGPRKKPNGRTDA